MMKTKRTALLCLLMSLAPCPGVEPLRTLAEVRALSDDAARSWSARARRGGGALR